MQYDLLSDQGPRYPDVEFTTGALSRSSPISQTKNTKIQLQVRFQVGGVRAGDEFRVKGIAVIAGAPIVNFEGEAKTATTTDGNAWWNLTSVENLPDRVGVVNLKITWVLERRTEGGVWTLMDIASDGYTEVSQHEILVTAGRPRETGGVATYVRVKNSVVYVNHAVKEYYARGETPTAARMVANTLRLHLFDLDKGWLDLRTLPGTRRAWTVPQTWQLPLEGSDCGRRKGTGVVSDANDGRG